MLGTGNFTDEFKRDAVAQITERGYPAREVSARPGVSTHSLYAWKRKFAKVVSCEAEKDAEIRRLKRELARVSEERDILKKGEPVSAIGPRTVASAYFAGMQSEIRVRGPASQAVFCPGDVSLPAHPAERVPCLAASTDEQASPGRQAPDRAAAEGLGRERQGLRLPQAA